ncbi:MAG: HTH domain-containing protein, partial [Spirochaetia bacterium]|nr:HTH domain-containing protein [Spirochaetia bacterium]
PYIVERLRGATKPVSGQTMAEELGLSRVALWKRIETLKAWGYGIEASRRGYRLVHDDGLAPWDFDAPGPVHLFDDIPSTMDKAHELAVAGAPSGTMVLALRQSAGRDRSGSGWISPSGGLYLSLVLRSALPPALAGTMILEAARSTLGLLEEVGISGLSFAWPGALLGRSDLPGKPARLGGLLLELAGAMGRVDHYVLGLGLNVAPVRYIDRASVGDTARSPAKAPGDAREPTGGGGVAGVDRRFVSLGDLAARPPQRARLAADLARDMAEWSADPQLDPGRWASLLPEGPRTALLWTGDQLDVVPVAYTARGELLCTGGRLLSIGECVKLREKGAC